jgi:hypothetical protein
MRQADKADSRTEDRLILGSRSHEDDPMAAGRLAGQPPDCAFNAFLCCRPLSAQGRMSSALDLSCRKLAIVDAL